MALAVLVAVVAVAALLLRGGADEPAPQPAAQRDAAAKPVELPRGGRRLLPDRRIVAFYGAPQSAELGELGIGSPASAARRLERQARAYAQPSRPVLPGDGADRGHRGRRTRARAAATRRARTTR